MELTCPIIDDDVDVDVDIGNTLRCVYISGVGNL